MSCPKCGTETTDRVLEASQKRRMLRMRTAEVCPVHGKVRGSKQIMQCEPDMRARDN